MSVKIEPNRELLKFLHHCWMNEVKMSSKLGRDRVAHSTNGFLPGLSVRKESELGVEELVGEADRDVDT